MPGGAGTGCAVEPGRAEDAKRQAAPGWSGGARARGAAWGTGRETADRCAKTIVGKKPRQNEVTFALGSNSRKPLLFRQLGVLRRSNLRQCYYTGSPDLSSKKHYSTIVLHLNPFVIILT